MTQFTAKTRSESGTHIVFLVILFARPTLPLCGL